MIVEPECYWLKVLGWVCRHLESGVAIIETSNIIDIKTIALIRLGCDRLL